VLKISSKIFIGFALIAFSAPAFADKDDDILAHILGTPVSALNSHAAIVKPLKNDDSLRLTSNKDEVIRLSQDAASVIVNNPDHANVLLDSPRLLIVMPRQPGVTSFSVLNSAGEIILHKNIIVTNAQQQYVRIRRVCNGTDPSCVPAAYYYCPDGCYEVTPVAGSSNIANIPPPAGSGTSSSGLNLPSVLDELDLSKLPSAPSITK
jgi:hypothetical protein